MYKYNILINLTLNQSQTSNQVLKFSLHFPKQRPPGHEGGLKIYERWIFTPSKTSLAFD